MAALDVMAVRLHLRALRVLEVVVDLPESLVVAVEAVSNVIRCSACGHKTATVHATRKLEVRDLAVAGRPVIDRSFATPRTKPTSTAKLSEKLSRPRPRTPPH